MRQEWELSKDSSLKQRLLKYNADDCEALERITTIVAGLCQRDPMGKVTEHSYVVHAESMQPNYPYRFGKRDFAIPELQYINRAAYWDNQRDKIHFRSSPAPHQNFITNRRHSTNHLPIDVIVELPLPRYCPSCNTTNIRKHDIRSKIVYDVRLDSSGIKRWIVRYVFQRYFCRQCRKVFISPDKSWTRNKYGWELVAYVIYQIIDLQVHQSAVAKSLDQLFRLNINGSTLTWIKAQAAKFYQDGYNQIIEKIVKGKLIHADETKVDIQGQSGFVWVIASLEEVAYFYTETREGGRIQTLLADFKGVLISDFYAAYDSINCSHQRCLIHLIRDLNEDIQKEPFNSELKALTQEFGILLKSMVETVDRFGLKADYLRHHKISVEEFYSRLLERVFKDDVAVKYKKRFLKYRDQLFTFLDYDRVPWNNNYAEAAIKTFARLRRVIGGASTVGGLQNYLTLLSMSETCKYKDVSFLEFLRSGEKDIDRFIEGHSLAIPAT